ncbi:MAG: hypothetical protein GKR77_07645 [Legionellales bacterium]|nr:hypothetical protein [Legionellales bacterium]
MHLYLLQPLDNPHGKTKLVFADSEEHAREIADRHPHPLSGGDEAVNYETMGDLFYANRMHASCQELIEGKQYDITTQDQGQYQIKLHLKFNDQRVVSISANQATSLD